MTTNKNARKRTRLLNLSRLLVLAICFVAVFALALSAETFGWFDNTDISVNDNSPNIADAASTAGSTNNAITASGLGSLINFKDSASSNYFPNSLNSTAKTWVYEYSLGSTAFGDSNISYWSGAGGATVSGGTGTFTFKSNGGETGWNVATVNFEMNSQLLEQIANLKRISNFSVKVTFTTTNNISIDNWTSMRLFSSETKLSGSDLSSRGEDQVFTNKSKKSSGDYNFSETIDLTESSRYLVLVFGFGQAGNNGWFTTCNCTPKNMSLKFEIALNTSDDESVRSYNDGSAPIVASSVLGDSNLANVHVPYRPNVSALSDQNAWPVYNKDNAYINNLLTGVTDSVVNGNGKMISYQNAKEDSSYMIWGPNGNKYWKKRSVVNYIDTFDFTGSNGLTGELLNGWTSSDFYDKDRYKLMSIGGYQMTSYNGTLGQINWSGGALNSAVTSGIKEVVVGDNRSDGAVFVTKDIGDGGAETRNLYVGGVWVGYARVTKDNRSKISVAVYVWANANVTTQVSDFGNNKISTTIEYSGIDTTAPETMALNSSQANTDKDATIDWTYTSNVTLTADDKTRTNSGTPYIWFYSAAYEPSKAKGFSQLTSYYGQYGLSYTTYREFISAYESLGRTDIPKPFAVGNMPNFVYDFTTGQAAGQGTVQGRIDNIGGKNYTGSGYYMFTFYGFDLAGNAAAQVNYYVKVDYLTPEYYVTYQYKGSDGNFHPVLPKTEYDAIVGTPQFDPFTKYNTQWLTGEVRLELDLSHSMNNVHIGDNISGTTITFADSDGKTHILVIDDGKLLLYAQGNGARIKPSEINSSEYKSANANWDEDTQTLTLDVQTAHDAAILTVQLVQVEHDGHMHSTIVFTCANRALNDGRYKNLKWALNFNAYTGQDTVNQNTAWHTTRWGSGGININVDRNNPNTPILKENNDTGKNVYLENLGNGFNLEEITIKDIKNRKWFTTLNSSNFTMPSAVEFTDSLTRSYGNEIIVSVGLRTFANLDDFKNSDLMTFIADFYTMTVDQRRSYFTNEKNGSFTFSGSDWNGHDSNVPWNLSLNLMRSFDAGVRVIFTWAIDQAGNLSGLNAYYVLADPNTYSISAETIQNQLIGENKARVSAANPADNNQNRNYRRGQTVKFTFSFDDTFVPYTFGRNMGNTVTNLLYNNTQNAVWQINKEFNGVGTLGTGSTLTFEYVLDEPDDISKLAADLALKFEMTYRKVVEINLTNSMVQYTSLPTVAPIVYSVPAAEQHVKLVYYYGNINEKAVLKEYDNGREDLSGSDRNKPIIPNAKGEFYYLKIWIPQDDPDYVQSNYAEDENGNQIFYIEDVSVDDNENVIPNNHTHIRKYTIINGTAEVKAVATQSTYNDQITITYTINGHTPEEAYTIYAGHNLKGKVSLNNITMRPGQYGTSYLPANNKIGVGKYIIVASEAFSLDYYDVTFSSEFHEIIARTIYVDVVGDEKRYGDPDPSIKFTVDSSQFADRQNVTDEVFTKELFGNPLAQTPDGLYTFNSGSRISRAAGENVGEYRYTASSSAFDVSSNYVISVRTNAQFYIRQREIKLNVSGQSTVRSISDNFDPNNADMWKGIKLGYEFVDADDVRFVDMITGSPMLESYIGAKSEDGYTAVYEFRIGKGTIEDTLNIKFIIVSEQDKDTIYTVYIAGAGTVIIRAKEGASFKYVFGTAWNSKTTLRFDAELFDIEKSEELVIDKIEWEANFPDIVDGGYMPIGIARVSIVNAKIYRLVEGSTDQYEEIVNFRVFVEAVNVTVDQAEITVRPTATNTQKTYGSADVAYSFGFEIEAINGTPISEIGNSFANILVDDIRSAISGSFARGVYFADGTFKTSGTRYDGASDKNGTVLGAIDANGIQAECTDFYGYSVGVGFSSSNNNFKVACNLHQEERLVINPYVLVVNDSMFIGKSKVKDNTTTVTYGSDELALDLSRLLVNGSDDVKVSFNAEYGSANIGKTHITFSKLGLVGEKGASYVLALENESHIVTDADTVKIFYINNAKDSNGNIIDPSEANEIWIKAGEIAVLKSDISISKQYDNTTVLSIANVDVRNRTDENSRGTSQLSTAMSNGKATLLSGRYTASAVGSNYMMTVVIFFEMDMTGITIYRSENYANADVAPRRVDNEDILGDGILRTGVELTIRNTQASIGKRILNENSFINVAAQDRAYNATSEVEVTFAYKDDALAHGETAESVGVRLFADTANGEKDTGDYQVVFSGSRIQKSDNYDVDIASLNRYFSGSRQLNVHISRAMLYPNVEFTGKEYDGSDTVVLKVKEDTTETEKKTDLTTQEYATELRKELECFSYNKDKVVFVYSANGKNDANVVVDAEGNAIMHNVMIKNLVITETGGKGYLKNYAILGSRYAGASYSAVGSVTNADKDGDSYIISDYEMLGAAELKKRPVVISDNDINLSDKVFDGTTDAPVTVSMPERIVETDREHFKLTASARFSRMHVGNNSIDVSDITIAPNAGFEYLMNNYAIEVRHGTLSKNIFAKPIAVNVDLGSQIYDGTPNVKSRNITYGMDGFIGSDASKYNIDATAAYFIDKNVAVDKDGNVIRKDGTVYNLLLSNPTQNFMNYVLADKVVIDRNNTAQPSDPDASVAAEGETTAKPQVKAGYFAYELENGTIVYGTAPENFTGVVAVYYELGVATKYILANDADGIANAQKQGALIGYFRTPDGINCYLVTDEYAGATHNLVTPVTYSKNASGVIEKRAVSISNVTLKNGNTVIEKEFDGTNKYFGVKGEDYEFDGIYNKVGNDKVEVNEVSAIFSSANTDARYVLFTASSITGDDAQNYTFDASRQVSVPGRITQRTITAQLHDGSVPYGTLASEVGGKITYTISRVIRTVTPGEGEGGEDTVTETPVTYDLIQDGNSFYLEFNKFLVIVGFIDDVNGTVKDEDIAYVNALRKESYNKLDDGSFQLAADGNGEYRRLSGNFTALPKPVANFGAESRPSAGTVINDYKLTEGKAGNYKFQPKYSDATDGSNGTTSKLTITKRNLYVTTSVKYYGRLYGEANPDIRIIYTDDDRNTLNAIVSGESPNTIFGSTDRFPKAAFGIYNSKTGEITPIASNALVTDDLEEGLFYVAYITLEGFDAEASNYNVVVATLGYSDEDGVYYSFDGGNLGKEAATRLDISLPEFSGITAVANAQVTYNGKDQTSALVNGTAAGDRVQIINANNGRISAIDADTYTGQVIVSRDLAPVAVNGKTYSIEWTSAQDVTLVIGKASPRLSADNKSTSFNGKVQSYDKNNVRLGVDGLDFSNDDISITVMKRVDNNYVKSELRDAGNYRVTVTFTSRNRNYNDESVDVSYVISKAVIKIDITSQLEQIFDENNNYTVEYTVGSNTFDITKADTAVKFYKNDRETQIDRAGRYQFRVTLVGDWADDADNFTLMGGMGNLDLTVNSISDVDANVVKATVAIKDDGTILADRLSTRVVYEYNTSSRDDLYYQSLSGYMPYISNSVGTDAKISAIVRMELSYGSNGTNLNGKNATITVALPDNVRNTLDETAIYIVNKNGGLTKLTDYEIKNGNITYSADYLGSLVFVKLGTEGQSWILYTVLGVVGGLLLIAAIIVTVTVIRKKQLEKLV